MAIHNFDKYLISRVMLDNYIKIQTMQEKGRLRDQPDERGQLTPFNPKFSLESYSNSPSNFGGQNCELWCAGGEIGFLTRMANESIEYASQVYYFTSLVSKGENIAPLKTLLSRLGAQKIDVIRMSQGQKVSRLLVWSFLADF